MVVAVVALVLANLADSGKKRQTTAPGTTISPSAEKAAGLKLVIGPVNVQNVGPPAKIKAPVRRVLLHAAQVYVDDAILAPLMHGRIITGYEKLFDAGVKPAASGTDRAVLTEARTGRARGPVRATASKVALDGLGDQTGKPLLVAATFTMTVNATTPVGRVKIIRYTELTFANEFGRWLVTAYRVAVRRSLGAKTTSVVVHAGSGVTT